jgi:hypothetical protein
MCESVLPGYFSGIRISYNLSVCPVISGVPRNFFGEGGLTNSVEDRGQREWGSGGCSPLVRDSTQFANE